ncbi:PepSY-associated TM helix domain-containing protein [Coraliomargarita sp. SDUM461004]|uniref:PepSY-associated TM helix domain-containing protein n=1 Tax=Thalassobacterium sedimentorum TaxID=3041258 RepID=A0ABU1AL84_9BACT|nr:PepSY-associated TM helix domain-containing protein [Coraliomargarita sp. SDUM461004]MDQ8194348.1 PepSY-associated TM helix domain-containing protein [Coraliomargarita sp. SDUM461004]
MKIKTIWKIHSWLGLVAGIPLLLIALTGSLLVFKDELNAWLIPEQALVEPTSAGPLKLVERLAALRAGLPMHEVTGWSLGKGPKDADFVYVMAHGDNEWLHVYQNPYTGEILSEPAPLNAQLMEWLLDVHYTFLADDLGMAICALLAILLCLLAVTGFFIYRKFWKNFLRLRWRTSLRLLSGNLHKRVGVLAAPILLILGGTGAYWNIDHVLHELEHHAEEDGAHEPYLMAGGLYAADLPLDALAEQARETIPEYKINYIGFPWEPGVDIIFWGSFEGQSPLRSQHHSTVAFNAQTGAYVSNTRMNEASLWKQIEDSFEPLHYGTVGGLLTRVLWCVCGAAPGFLALSGFFIRWKRGY